MTPEDIFTQYTSLIASSGGLNFAAFKAIIKDQINMVSTQRGNFFVLLSLQEAEHLRGIIHGRMGRPLIDGEGESQVAAGMNEWDIKLCNANMWTMGDAGKSCA